MRPGYPNLELMEYKSFIAFKDNKELSKKFEEAKEKRGRFAGFDFVAEAFTQVWGNCDCPRCSNKVGQNLLGKTLMKVREELRNS